MKLLKFCMENKGKLYSLLFAVMLTMQANLGKVLTYSSHSSYITFVRCFFRVFTLPLVEFDEATTCDITTLILYLTCAVLGVIPYGTAVLSYTLMGVGDSTAIEFGGSVILIGVISHLVLDEKLTISYFILLLVDCVGIILVVKPTFIFRTSEEGITSKETGAIFALIGTLFLSFYSVCVRKLEKRNTLHCFLLITVQGLVGMTLCGAWTTVESAWEIPDTWLNVCLVVGYGLVCIIQSVSAIKALANEETKNVAMASTLSVVMSYVLQLTVFEEELDWVSIGGAVTIVLCVALSSSWEYVQEKLDKLRYPYEKLDDENINGISP